jgi:hypothetical protein
VEVVPARDEKRIVGRKRRCRNRVRTPIVALRVDKPPGAFAHDTKIVERIREIGMSGAELGFLTAGNLAQQPLG